MAAPRQSVARQARAIHSNTGQSPTPKAPSRQNSTPVIDDEAILHPDDEVAKAELSREAERQTRFQKGSNDRLHIPSGYRKVEVLIIRWDESIDEFKGHKEEIERLQSLFSTDFGYSCTVARIRNCQNPQIDLNFEILQHVRQHDGEDNLLIVYYTGHGNQIIDKKNGQRLELSATESPEETSGYPPSAFWDKAEEPLRTLAVGDVLVILDCCFASTAAFKGRNEELRIYQLLAASSPDGPTSGPGEQSFTTALCNSLEELLLESKGESFPVLKLSERINKKRTEQSSLLWDRLERYKRSVKLGRLEPNPERDASFRKEGPEKASLLLRLSLKTEDLDDRQIDKLARQLPDACKDAGVGVRRIEWVKMEQRDPKKIFRKAVKKTMEMNLRRKSSPGKLQQQKGTPQAKKRTRSDTPLLSTPKRQARESSLMCEETRDSVSCTPLRSQTER